MVSMRKQSGFSLVELSIVLVILGLLVGGVLAGQSLIRAAELRSVSTEHSRYITAVQSFRDKYFAIPGDMTNATAFWGAADPTPATCRTTASTSTATCNGDGSGLLSTVAVGSNEIYRFWQHLANAGLIEGSFNGVSGGSVNLFTSVRENSPTGKMNNTLWFVFNYSTFSGSNQYFDGVYSNVFKIGQARANEHPFGGFLIAEEAWNIDQKMDDGMPATGRIRLYVANGLSECTDTVANNPATISANYRLQSTLRSCSLVFPQAF